MNAIRCRTCLGHENLRSIFNSDEDSKSISSRIMLIASVTIKIGDNLPQYICDECYKKLQDSLEFKLQCERSDQQYRKLWMDENNQFYLNNSTISTTTILPRRTFEENKEVFVIKCEVEAEIPDIDSDDQFDSIESTSDKPTKIRTPTKRLLNQNSAKTVRLEKKKIIKIKSRPQCSVCGKIVSSEFRMKCHMRVHTGEKPFKCSYCNRDFSLAYNLKIHERTHTGERPLNCGICGKSFAQSASLVTHVRIHTGEKPYKCNLCSMTFINCSNLTYHKRMHSNEKNYVCDTCQRAFIAKSDLTQHMKIHSGERAFVCTVCGIKLSRNYHLTRHMQTHSNEKQHKCDLCPNSYKQKSDLTRHRKRIHQQELVSQKSISMDQQTEPLTKNSEIS